MLPVKIVIADDHVMIREGIRQLLELDGDIKVIGEANDGIECLQIIREMNPDVLLLDINMPKMNGLEVLEKLKCFPKRVNVLILTIHNEIEYLVKAVGIGVNGYVLKDSGSDLLKRAIFAVHAGETFIQPNLAPLLQNKIEMPVEKMVDISVLTKREIEVLKLLAVGLFNREIGKQLEISEKTVKNHVSHILKKIKVSDRTQAAIYAIKNNVVDIM